MSHPSDTPHSSHVESRSRKALRSYIIQASTLLEIVLSGLVLIGLLLSASFPCSGGCPACCSTATMVEIRGFLERALDIVIGIEFIKMLAKHSPGSSLEVLLYAIARHLVVAMTRRHGKPAQCAIALIFIVRKYFFCPCLWCPSAGRPPSLRPFARAKRHPLAAPRTGNRTGRGTNNLTKKSKPPAKPVA